MRKLLVVKKGNVIPVYINMYVTQVIVMLIVI